MRQIGLYSCGHLNCFGGNGGLDVWANLVCHTCHDNNPGRITICEGNADHLIRAWEEQAENNG